MSIQKKAKKYFAGIFGGWDGEGFVFPKRVQDAVPIKEIYDDGMFRVAENTYSMMWSFSDINYESVDVDEKKELCKRYINLINTFDNEAHTKIILNHRKIDGIDLKNKIFLKEKDDGLDKYRKDYNKMILSQTEYGNGMMTDKYLVVSVQKGDARTAKRYFENTDKTFKDALKNMGSTCRMIGIKKRLAILHGFYNPDDTGYFDLDIRECNKRGEDIRDYICPPSMEFERNRFRMGDKWGRVLYFKGLGSSIGTELVSDLLDTDCQMMISVDVSPVPVDKAIDLVNKKLLGIEKNIEDYRNRKSRNGHTVEAPWQVMQQREYVIDFLNDLTNRNQRMTQSVITIVIVTDTEEDLNMQTEQLNAKQKRNEIKTLTYQQLDGLNTTLPIGLNRLPQNRTLTSENLAAFMPFRAEEVIQEGGIYYGQNIISKNMIIVDRSDRGTLQNGNSLILAVPGAGKSFIAKQEIFFNVLNDENADIMIIDPEREYNRLVEALGGEVINISATSNSHINALDINKDYGEAGDPLVFKSEFVMSLYEQCVNGKGVGAAQKSIIDRCVRNVYKAFKENNYEGDPPTLVDFSEELKKQTEPEARQIALNMELFVSGSLNTFALQTNVDIHNRLIAYDVLDLGEQLMPIGMLVVLDSIFNRVTRNRVKGKNTYIYIDEIYLLLQHEYSAQFLNKLWKRVRKYGACATGITQNVTDLLNNYNASNLLSNSEMIIMLNQAGEDREKLAGLLGITNAQLGYITNAGVGSGLMKIGSSMVPFTNHFPTDLEMYRLMSTTPGEK